MKVVVKYLQSDVGSKEAFDKLDALSSVIGTNWPRLVGFSRKINVNSTYEEDKYGTLTLNGFDFSQLGSIDDIYRNLLTAINSAGVSSVMIVREIQLNNRIAVYVEPEKQKRFESILSKCDLTKFSDSNVIGQVFRRTAGFGSVEDLEFLASCIDSVDESGEKTNKTALHIATINRRSDSITVLKTLGASLDLLDVDGKTAYDYAWLQRETRLKILNTASVEKKEKVQNELATLENIIPELIPNYYTILRDEMMHYVSLGISAETQGLSFFILQLYHAINQGVDHSNLRKHKYHFIVKGDVTFEIKNSKLLKLEGGITEAEFSPKVNKIYLYFNLLNVLPIYGLIRILFHEIEHAYKFHLHVYRNKRFPEIQHSKDIEITADSFARPFFPFVLDEYNKLMRLVSLGNDRIIKEFYGLLKRSSDRNSFEPEEEETFQRYIDATMNYQASNRTFLFDKEDLEKHFTEETLKAIASGEFVEITISYGNYAAPLFVNSVKKNDENCWLVRGTHASDKCLPPYAFVFDTIARIHGKDNYEGFHIIAEHHARTVGELPQHIVETFYAELLEYDQKDRAAAIDSTDELAYKFEHLNISFFHSSALVPRIFFGEDGKQNYVNIRWSPIGS